MVKARKGTITEQDIKEAALNDLHFERATNNITLFERVKELEKVAADEDKALEDVIKENVHPSDRNKALELAGYITRNETPYIKEDGTICLKVEKWQDAAKVTEEELTEQLRTMDEELREAATENKTGEIIRDGDSALSLMDKTVRETWENRKYIGKNEDLTLTNAKDIITYYKDKFKIDNNIKIKFVDGLGADGSTTRTTYLGKGKGKLPDILIQMDKNAKNPYATLRSEIEHARDLAKGQVPDQKVQHLSRYKGLNEAEIAPFYIKKKADSAQKREAPLKLEENISKYEKEGFSFKEAPASQYDPANKIYLEKEGKRLGNLSYYVDDENCLHIEHVVNETQALYDVALRHRTPVKGVADRLIEKAITNNPDVSYIIWDIAEGEAPLKLLNGFKQRHPELARRIVSQEEYDRLAKKPVHGYNNQKEGVSNNAESDRSINGTGNVAGMGKNGSDDIPAGMANNTQGGEYASNTQRTVSDSDKGINGGGSATSNGLEREVGENELSGHKGAARQSAKSLTETLDDTLTGKVPFDEITLEDILLKAEKEIPVSGRTFEAVKNDSEHLAETLMKLKDEGQTALLEAFYKNPQGKFKIRLRAQVKILVTALSRRRNCAD